MDLRLIDWLVWFTFIISETLTAAIAVGLLINIYKKKLTVLCAPPDKEEQK